MYYKKFIIAVYASISRRLQGTLLNARTISRIPAGAKHNIGSSSELLNYKQFYEFRSMPLTQELTQDARVLNILVRVQTVPTINRSMNSGAETVTVSISTVVGFVRCSWPRRCDSRARRPIKLILKISLPIYQFGTKNLATKFFYLKK